MQLTDEPHIETLLAKYSSTPDLLVLALGSCYWTPPQEALATTFAEVSSSLVAHRYGGGFGLDTLLAGIRRRMISKGVHMEELEIMVTPGANQAFANTVFAVCDPGDTAILLAPMYFSHLMALQTANVAVSICPFDPTTFLPIWATLAELVKEKRPKLLVLTTPNNPSGKVWTLSEIQLLVDLCKSVDAWLVVDQTYAEFEYDGAVHQIPCSCLVGYSRIIHVFSFSKAFGMPGWRVGYIIYPTILSAGLSKVQDALPTHAPICSQMLAAHCLALDDEYTALHNGCSWVHSKVATLIPLREKIFPIVARLGTILTHGAMYMLVPVPKHVSEDEAVHTLATEFGVLLIQGRVFGASGHLRLSYGSIPPEKVLLACDRLRFGVARLIEMSDKRIVELESRREGGTK